MAKFRFQLRAGEYQPLVARMAVQRAPKGGITIGGKKFKGGEFIPGEVLAKASTAEKAQLAKAKTSTARPAAAKKSTKKAPSARAQKALATHKPSTREKQKFALDRESELAKALQAMRLDDNEPMDVILTAPDGTRHGFEVKTLMDNRNDKITMHPSSRRRKEQWAKDCGDCFIHTVVIDDRDRFQGGANKAQHSGHRIYYANGVGAFRIKSMQQLKSFADLKRIALSAGQTT